MTTGSGESTVAGGDNSFARDWQALRADGDIQFAPVEMPPAPETPRWLEVIGEFFEMLMKPLVDAFGALGRLLGLSGQAIMWILIAGAILVTAALAWRYVVPLLEQRRSRQSAAPEHWAPTTGEALALLEEADRLAAAGLYAEATHLLLKRSIGQIEAARPGLLEPSSTAREISALPALPEAARRAFATIAGRVERSLFALRSLDADDWRTARDAYADFALAAPGFSGPAA